MSLDLTKPLRFKGTNSRFFLLQNYREYPGLSPGEYPGVYLIPGEPPYFTVMHHNNLENVPEPRAFLLRVEGDSMYAKEPSTPNRYGQIEVPSGWCLCEITWDAAGAMHVREVLSRR